MTKKAYCFVCRLSFPQGCSDDAFTKKDLSVNTVKNHKDKNTIIFLSKQGLSFRGQHENDKSENKGNLLND